MQEMWVQSLDWEDPLEEEMATDSSTLAWEIPWTEEPGELQSTVLQKSRTRLSKQLNNNDKASPNILLAHVCHSIASNFHSIYLSAGVTQCFRTNMLFKGSVHKVYQVHED